MTPSTTQSSSFKIIQQQDGRSSSYHARLSDQQWEDLRPLVEELFKQGSTVANILRQLKLDNVIVTRSQLDTRMRTWDIRSLKPKASGRWAARLRASNPPHDVSPELFNFGFKSAPEPSPEALQLDIAQPNRQAEINSPVAVDGGLKSSKIQHEQTSHPDHPVSLRTSQPTNPEQSLPAKPVSPSWSQHSGGLPDSHPPTAQIGLSHEGSALQGTEILSDASILNGSQHTTSSLETSPSSVDTTKTDDEGSVSSNGDASSLTYKRIRLPIYGPSLISQQLWRYFVTEKSGKIVEMIPGLATIAGSLSQARRFAEAFDIFFLMTYGLNDAIVQDQSMGPLLPFFAIKCVRSACSREQMVTAKMLKEQLRVWHDECYPFGWDLSPKTALNVRELLRMSEMLYRQDEGRGMGSYYPASGVLLEFMNDNDEFSAWLNARELWPKTTDYWPRDILNTFFESRWIQQAMLEALREIQARLQYSSADIDDALGIYWPPDSGNCDAMALVLVSSVMQHHVATSARPGGAMNNQSTESGHPRWFSRFKELSMITLPFLMTHWLYQPEILQDDLYIGDLFRKHDSGCSDTLRLATLRLQQDLDLEPGTASYKDFMSVYIREMSARCPSTTRFEFFLIDRIVWLAASMTGAISTSPDVDPFITPTETSDPSSNPLHPNFALPPSHLDSLASDVLRLSLSDVSPNPPAARSYTSSLSSDYKSFKERSVLHPILGSSSGRSHRSASSSKVSDPMSWKIESTADTSSIRGSFSNASMGGLDEYAAGLGALAAMRQNGSML